MRHVPARRPVAEAALIVGVSQLFAVAFAGTLKDYYAVFRPTATLVAAYWPLVGLAALAGAARGRSLSRVIWATGLVVFAGVVLWVGLG